MKGKQTIILLILTILVGSYLYYFEIYQPKKKEDIKKHEMEVFPDNLTINKIDSINIKQLKNNIILTHDTTTNNWFIKNPIQEKADSLFMETYLTALLNLKKEKIYLKEKFNASLFGLNPAKSDLRISTTDSIYHIKLGNLTPTGKNFYFQIDNENILYGGNSDRFFELDKELYDFRNKHIFSKINLNTIKKIRIIKNNKKIYIIKEKNRWIVQSGNTSDLCDNKILSDIIDNCNAAEAKRFYDSPNKDLFQAFGLNTKKNLFEIELINGQKYSLHIGKPIAQNFYAYLEGEKKIIELNSNIIDHILLDFDKLRTTEWMDYSDSLLTKITLKIDKKAFTFTKKDTIWQGNIPDTSKTIADLLLDIKDIALTQITRFTVSKTEWNNTKNIMLTLYLTYNKSDKQNVKIWKDGRAWYMYSMGRRNFYAEILDKDIIEQIRKYFL